jgi:peptide/nickel transport system substrate-binding protein
VIKTPHGGPANLRFGAGSIWVGSRVGTSVFRINPRTNRFTRVPAGAEPSTLAAGDNAVWVANRTTGTVTRINPRTNRIVARIKVGRLPSNPAIAVDGTVFVPNAGSGTVSRIDPGTNRVVQTLRVGGGPYPSTSAFGDVWVPDFQGDSIFRIDVP